MSSDYFEKVENDLKDGRQTALEIVKSIEVDFQRRNKDAPTNGLKFALNLLITFFRVYRATGQKAHYDVFVDIYARILAPQLDANASPTHFKRLLPSLEHLYLTITAYKLQSEAEKLYKCIVEQQMKWSDADGFKILLNIHGTQIIMLCENRRQNLDTQSAAANSNQLDESIAKISALFKFASKNHKQTELNAFNVTNYFMESLRIQKNVARMLITTSLSKNQKEILFQTFFDLLNAVSLTPLPAKVSPDIAFSVQLKACYTLLKMDVSDNLQQQLAPKHMKICREIVYAKHHQYIATSAKLLYNMSKLSYVRVIASNFKENYKILCKQICDLMKQAGVQFLDQVWFEDFLLLVYQLQINMHPTSNDGFYVFWTQMDDSLIARHFDFLYNLLEALSYTTHTDFFQYDCCKKELFSRHAQCVLTSFCIEIYDFILKKHEFCNREPFTTPMLAINAAFKKIIKSACQAMIEMDNNCQKAQWEMQKFNADFTNLLTAVKTPSQARYFIEVAQQVTDLKTRLPSNDWLMLMRRVYQLGAKTQHSDTAAELHCCYIAEVIAVKSVHTVPLLLHSQIHFLHNGIAVEVIKQGNCLLDIYMQSTSVFKPSLQKHQKRLLHWLDAQFIFSNYKKDAYVELYVNLAMRSQSKYDFLLAVSAGDLICRQNIKSKVENIYELLRSTKIKANNCTKDQGSGFTRMQELSLAHAAFLLWLERTEKQVKNLNTKVFLENNFVQLMQEKTLNDFNAKNEMKNVEMALDALNAFQSFYEKADIEPIPEYEGGFIDWQRIVENLTSLATFFQISGYMDYALKTWLLHYRIAKNIDDKQSCVRSLIFFCEYSHFLKNDENDEPLDISEEINAMSNELKNILIELPQMLRRYQNFTLICMCQIAYFYATKMRHKDAYSYLNYVRKIHAELERGNKYDIVLFTADIVQFRILWKFNNADNECKQICLTNEIEIILKRLEGFVNISSVDTTLFNLLIISAVADFAEFTANRLIENSLNGFFACCLKISVDFGAAILATKLLSKWAAINLQMEYLQRAEIKFLLIEVILGIRDAEEIVAYFKKQSKENEDKVVENQTSLIIPANHDVALVRKVAVVSPSAFLQNEKQRISSMAFNLKLEHFLDVKKNEVIVQQSHSTTTQTVIKNNLLLWTRLNLGALRARFNFLAKNNEELENFYESCLEWLRKHRNTFHFKLCYSEILMCLCNYANYLRSSQQFDKAIELIEIFTNDFQVVALSANVDPACHLNLQQQLKDTKLEQFELKNRNLPKRKKLMLESSSPTLVFPTTPQHKTTRYAQLPMTVQTNNNKKVFTGTSTAFRIYSDRKRTDKTATATKRDLLKNTSIKKDLKFTETEDNKYHVHNKTNAVIELLSDSETETEAETLKSTKKSTIVPKLIFTEAIGLLEDDTPKNQTKDTKVSKTKKSEKSQEHVKTIEQCLESLTIKPKIAVLHSDSEQYSPEPTLSVGIVKSNENDIFKTPSSSLPTASSKKIRTTQKRSTKRVESSNTDSLTPPSSSNSSDNGSSNSNEEQIKEINAGMRCTRTRARQTSVVEDGSKSATLTSTTASRRRPR